MDDTILIFRRFNRFYTRLLGLLGRKLLDGPLSLAEARMLFEVTASPGVTAVALTRKLGMDRGQASRVLAALRKQGLVKRDGEPGGRRVLPLHPTAAGRELMAELDARSNSQAGRFMALLGDRGRTRLRASLQEVERLLGAAEAGDEPEHAPVGLREADVGDLGWIVSRHGEIYAAEYGFTKEFEGYVIRGLAEFLSRPEERSRIWIAEQAGAAVGSVGVVDQEDGRAMLRWLLVEPHARGLGAGRLLVDKAVSFCRDRGYREIFLWTLEMLHSAKRLYASYGFHLQGAKPGRMGGHPLVEERWVLDLQAGGDVKPGPLADACDSA